MADLISVSTAQENAYSQYLMVSTAQAFDIIDQHEDYDTAWAMAGELLVEFNNSKFDVDTKSELDCIVDFMYVKKN